MQSYFITSNIAYKIVKYVNVIKFIGHYEKLLISYITIYDIPILTMKYMRYL